MKYQLVLVLSNLYFFPVYSVNLLEMDEYVQERAKILLAEEKQTIGGHISLTEKEKLVNDILLHAKAKDLDESYGNTSKFLPSLHFFDAQPLIKKSRVFSIIQRLPKGASLHTHLLAATSVDFLIDDVSYRDGLCGRYANGVFKLKFFEKPLDDWKPIKEMRAEQDGFDGWLRQQLILNVKRPKEAYPSIVSIWTKFKHVFSTVYDMLSYRPVFEDYVYRLLKELYDDNVMYTELRGTIMQLYELNGTVHSKSDFFKVFCDTVDRFKRDFPRFQGVKYIHSIYRGVDDEVLANGLAEIIQMKKEFPDFIVGFDFVGFEEEGNTLFHYRKQLLDAQQHLKFFFHAGETNWHGHTDLNLIDAILLNCSRIGHGYSIVKHPHLLKIATDRQIPLEICPISNQVLMLIDDQRNHPAAQLIAQGYPLIVGNDDPMIWNATGLSYDWYITFMAMTSKFTGLAFLKQLALNSIKYSSGGSHDLDNMLNRWELDWSDFLDAILKQ